MMGHGPESLSTTTTNADAGAWQDEVEVKSERDEDTIEQKDSDTVDGASEVDIVDEKVPLLGQTYTASSLATRSPSRTSIAKSVADAIVGTFRLVISAALAPGRYLIACFYNEQGQFAPMIPIYWVARKFSSGQRKAELDHNNVQQGPKKRLILNKFSAAADSLDDEKASPLTSESDADSDTSRPASMSEDSPARNTRSRTTPGPATEESDAAAPKRSPRIRIVSQDDLRRRKQRKSQASSAANSSQEPPLTMATIKSPTSAATSLRLTKYPRAPAPPRPLIPRRQPSYSALPPTNSSTQKTLVIDLDETLIHSMAKGGRMSTGHMVEVKLSSPFGHAGNVIGPQVPILYYVHKRPNCDEFLRKVSKWYNLIVFTASVQEYADPVIDWLELERKYFSARYYRQHCTYRNGAYIKDLSQVEPDLSRVMILDNSPMSYIFHEDNAIPIEGWISDPTDNDLLHLIPLFEGLQYTTDVRALLALRLGESIS